jgi:hypothetical protein
VESLTIKGNYSKEDPRTELTFIYWKEAVL